MSILVVLDLNFLACHDGLAFIAALRKAAAVWRRRLVIYRSTRTRAR